MKTTYLSIGLVIIACIIAIYFISCIAGPDILYGALYSALTNQTTVTLIVGAAGVAVSIITYIFQTKQLKLRGLVEVFRELNLPSHREARRIAYGGDVLDVSYDILGINPPSGDLGTAVAIDRVCEDIVKGDMNNAATLIAHDLMDRSIFLKEYWWIILRCWDKVEDRIFERRNSGTGASGYMHNLEELKDIAEAYARKNHSKDYDEYIKKYRTGRDKDPHKKDVYQK